MGNVTIDNGLKSKIEKLLKEERHKIRFQNLKGFLDNACYELLKKVEEEDKNETK